MATVGLRSIMGDVGLWPIAPRSDQLYGDKAFENFMVGRLVVLSRNVALLECEFTADANGDEHLFIPDGLGPWVIDRVVTKPSSDLSPTDNYDLKIVDMNGTDLLRDAGLNRDTSQVEWFWVAIPEGWQARCQTANYPIRIEVSNAGSAGAGVIGIFLKR